MVKKSPSQPFALHGIDNGKRELCDCGVLWHPDESGHPKACSWSYLTSYCYPSDVIDLATSVRYRNWASESPGVYEKNLRYRDSGDIERKPILKYSRSSLTTGRKITPVPSGSANGTTGFCIM